MERSYEDEYGFSGRDIFAAAITAAELAEVLHSPGLDESDDWADADGVDVEDAD